MSEKSDPIPMDGDDYITQGPTLAQRIDLAGKHLQQDLAQVDISTSDQRILGLIAGLEMRINAQDLRILKLEQRAEHADATAEQLGQIPFSIEWNGTAGGILNHEDGFHG